MNLSDSLAPVLCALGALTYLLCALVAWRLTNCRRWLARLAFAAAGPFTLVLYGLAALCWTA